MVIFPSKEWLEAVLEAVNKNESFRDATRHWESDFLCICNGDQELHRELSRREFLKGLLSLLEMMSPESRSKYKGTPTGSIFQVLGISLDAPLMKVGFDELTSKASTLSLDEVRLLSLFVWIEFHQGSIRNLTPVGPGEHENAAFKIYGNYSTWKQMVCGKQDVIRLVLSGKLIIVIARQPLRDLMRHMKAPLALSRQIFAEVPVD